VRVIVGGRGLMSEYIVRYGAMRFLGVFTASDGDQYRRGTAVIVRTDRGLETGKVLCRGGPEVVQRIKDLTEGQILRVMTQEDTNEVAQIRDQARRELEVCQRFVDQLGLQMQLVDVEHIFGGERVVVYYLADNRVDFRELVRMLAAEFQTRIEMRQIGVRDEAKLLADYGDCGTPVCCNNHLVQMPPVSMKMAKLQKATLDPTKISGRCGRLKCCLRYEYETYERIQKELPALGSMVVTPDGRAKVIGHEILTGQLLVVTEDRRRVLVDLWEASSSPAEAEEET
jgi:cell fate regulator YaaT (PSP1 superfamily)